MPTLFELFGIRFYFYSEEHLPIHVHIQNGDGRAKVNVYPEIEVVSSNGIKPKVMNTIKDIWFDANRIYVKTDDEKTFSRPLEAFPLLKDASDKERLDFKIGKFGDDVRWESLDEDIHISSFFETVEPDYENEIAMIFKRFPQLNVSEVARSMGINKSLLSKYIYGIKKPSDMRKMQIKEALHILGKELLAI